MRLTLQQMIRNPKAWREDAGLTLAAVAAEAGIAGINPSRTFNRYESGERPCPAEVIAAVQRLSGGKIKAQHWQDVRVAYLGHNGAKVK